MGAPVQRERVATQGAGDRRILDLQGLHFRPRRASLQRAVGGDRLGRVIGMGQGQAEGGGLARAGREQGHGALEIDLRSEGTRLNSSHSQISYAVFCLKKKKKEKKNSTHVR